MLKKIYLILPCLFICPGLFAEDIGETDVFEIFSQKVTSASRHEQDSELAPGAVTIITAEQIKKYGFNSIPDILRIVPGANVRWTPMGETVGFRSFGQSPFTDRVRFLINGIPYNSPLRGGFPILPNFLSFFPMEHIKRIEVIRGPSSALYGANAFWGVVNIVTKQGDDFNPHLYKKYGEGKFIFEGGSRATQKYNLSYGMRQGPSFQWSATAQYQREDGILNYINESLTELKDIYANFEIKDFDFSILHHDSENEPITFENFIVDTDFMTQQIDQTLDIASVGWRKAVRPSVEIWAKGSYMRREGTHCHVCHSPQIFTDDMVLPPERGKDDRIWGEVQVNCRATKRHYLIGGVEAFKDTIRVPEVEASLPAYREDELKSIAVFLQDEITLLKNTLFLTLGGRYDHHDTELPRSTQGNFSPRVSLVYSARPYLIFRTSFNRSYKQPSWNDLFGRFEFTAQPFEGFRQLIFGGQERVKEERTDSFEAGAEYLITEKNSLKVDFFYNRIHDFIYYHPGPILEFGEFEARYSIIQNAVPGYTADPISTWGGEFEWRSRWLECLQSTFSVALQDLDLDRENYKVPYTPREKLSLGLLFGPWNRMNASLRVHHHGAFYPSNLYYRGSVEESPSFTIMDAKLSYRLPVLSEALELSLIGRNLLDRQQKIPAKTDMFWLPGPEIFFEARINF
jgi:iron complex outermembrane receptor protein